MTSKPPELELAIDTANAPTRAIVVCDRVFNKMSEARKAGVVGHFLVKTVGISQHHVLCTGNIINGEWDWQYVTSPQANWPRGLLFGSTYNLLNLPEVQARNVPRLPGGIRDLTETGF